MILMTHNDPTARGDGRVEPIYPGDLSGLRAWRIDAPGT